MKRFKVYFDYEEEDSIEIMADDEQDALCQVVDRLKGETSDYDEFSDDDLMDSLNAKELV